MSAHLFLSIANACVANEEILKYTGQVLVKRA